MIKSNLEQERHTIPRWNSIFTAERLGELSSSKKQEKKEIVPATYIDSLLSDWKREKSLLLAIEIITNSSLSNSDANISDVVEYANNAVTKKNNVPELLSDFIDPHHKNREKEYPTDSHQITIKLLKQRLFNYPNDCLLWVELSREYTILGQYEKAKKAIQTAYGLSPNNRAVLRAIARFYTHISDHEQALYYLRQSSIVNNDPWVLAAEISISNVLRKTSNKIKVARQIVESNNFTPLSISELASELGTMEIYSGNSKLGKKRLKTASIEPFENAAAQLAWINNNVCNISSIIFSFPSSIECNFEAHTLLCLKNQDWVCAQKAAGLWQEYQPFSHNVALISSFISSDYLQDYDTAIKSIKCGLLSNPNNVDLMNNYIYALILSGNIEAAKKEYQHALSFDSGSEKKSVSLLATGGLLQYRCGNSQEGKRMYIDAIEQLKNDGKPELVFRATLCLAREEKLIGNSIDILLNEINSPKNSIFKKQYQRIIDNYNL